MIEATGFFAIAGINPGDFLDTRDVFERADVTDPGKAK